MSFSDHLRAKDWTFAATSRAGQERKEFALYILIASLGMFFVAAILGYLLIRLSVRTELPPVELPPVLWLSTLLAIAGSSLLWRALRSVRRERQSRFRKEILAAFVLGAGFCISQSIGLSIVLDAHMEAQARRQAVAAVPQEEKKPEIIVPSLHGPVLTPSSERLGQSPRGIGSGGTSPRDPAAGQVGLDGLLFMLILLHALHFVGGMVALTIVTVRSLAGRYDHEYHGGVKLCAVYWRFLDVVWIALFGSFLLAR